MYRFYCPEADFARTLVTIRDAHEIHHIKDVLRLKKGALIRIFNAISQQADAAIEAVTQDAIQVRVQNIMQAPVQAGGIILACAPPKRGKFELIIEKCTELGADEIIPLRTKRTEVIFKEEKMAGKLGRFEAVAVNASKQSQRLRIPRIHPMTGLPHLLKTLDPKGVHVFATLHNSSKHISEALRSVGRMTPVTVFIGPEGDFTPDEAEAALAAGCVAVSLGDTVLKTETAAIAAVALVKFLCRG